MTDKLIEEIRSLESQLEEAIEQRDDNEAALAKIHRLLGGDGEWVTRVPPQPPPNSGDLSLDVPEMVRVLVAKERVT